jgi:ribosomal RNA-processing protein 12
MADLALAMSENLPNASIDIFYKVIKPQLSDDDATTQKKSYRAFLEIIKKKSNLQVDEIYETLKETLSVCKPSSKKFRFKCFVELITQYNLVDKYIPQLIGEAIMGNKELNAETRELSLELLRSLINKFTFGTVTFDSQNVTEQHQQKLCVFMKQLLAGLGGKSEIMISATVVCLSTMLSEYAEWIQSVIPDIMNSVLLLLQYDNRQVIKSVLQFIKTALSVLDPEFISSFVPNLVKSLISFDGFASESIPLIKNIFTRLIKSYSYEKICELLPEEGNRQFLKNINKSIKKKKGKKEEKGNEREMYLEQDHEGDAIDILDSKMMKNITKKPIDENEEKIEKLEEFDENIQFNEKKGKFVIKEDAPEDLKAKNKKRKRGGEEGGDEISQESNKNEDVQLMDDFDEEIEDDEDAQEKAPYQPQQKKKRVEGGRKGYGEEYRGKRGAGGDVKRRDKPDPFAYIPLNPSEMNKRKKKESTFSEFDAYSKAARKGAASNNRRKKRY